jgi:antitoxin component of MazEF toxin-antitoxin module
MMRIVLTRYGDSLGLRIPKEIASRLGLAEGERLEIEATMTGSSSPSRGIAPFSATCSSA